MMDFDIFTQTAALWLRLSRPTGVARNRSRREDPGPRMVIFCLLALQSVEDGGGGASVEWVYRREQTHNMLCLSWIRRGFEIQVDSRLGFGLFMYAPRQHTEEGC